MTSTFDDICAGCWRHVWLTDVLTGLLTTLDRDIDILPRAAIRHCDIGDRVRDCRIGDAARHGQLPKLDLKGESPLVADVPKSN